MLREFYNLGVTHAFQKYAGVVGGMLRIPGAIAKNLARRKLIGETKKEMRDALGLETPEWRRGDILEEVRSIAQNTPGIASVPGVSSMSGTEQELPASPAPSIEEFEPKPVQMNPEPLAKKLRLPKIKFPK